MSSLSIDLELHSGGQLEVFNHPARFRILCCGRRWGKTLLGAVVCFDTLLRGGSSWWVAPIYPTAMIAWRKICILIDQIPRKVRDEMGLYTFKGDRRIVCESKGPNAWIEIKSADNPDSLLGEGLDQLVVDEAATIPQLTYDQYLYPTLGDKLGRALLISTPRKRNWFYLEYQHGQDASELDYASWLFPSNANPHLPKKAWEDAKRKYGEDSDVFRQEWLAQFLEGSAGVFRGVDSILGTMPCKHQGPFATGVDLAKVSDYTVCLAICKTCGCVKTVQRWTKMDWPEQQAKIEAFYRKCPGRMHIDATGSGDPMPSYLRQANVPSIPVKFSSQMKWNLVRALQSSIEEQRIWIPTEGHTSTVEKHAMEQLIHELRIYEHTLNEKTGTVSYSAPQGQNDDCVTALALANWGHQPGEAFVIV